LDEGNSGRFLFQRLCSVAPVPTCICPVFCWDPLHTLTRKMSPLQDMLDCLQGGNLNWKDCVACKSECVTTRVRSPAN
jgi:hypothetical protein